MTLTTERLKWLHDAATELSATKLKMTMRPDELLVLTSELLANREAQPVLYTSEETLVYAKEGEKSLVTWSEPMGDAMIPLFTVPPAPTSGVVNLPTEFISDEGVVVRLEQVMAALALVGVKYERRGDDCRAAMLAQPVSGGYTLNYPEIPDGWVSCEERMPEEGDVVLVCQEGGIIYCAEMQDGELYPDEFPRVPSEGREITHWMPLPAAPEVSRDDA